MLFLDQARMLGGPLITGTPRPTNATPSFLARRASATYILERNQMAVQAHARRSPRDKHMLALIVWQR